MIGESRELGYPSPAASPMEIDHMRGSSGYGHYGHYVKGNTISTEEFIKPIVEDYDNRGLALDNPDTQFVAGGLKGHRYLGSLERLNEDDQVNVLLRRMEADLDKTNNDILTLSGLQDNKSALPYEKIHSALSVRAKKYKKRKKCQRSASLPLIDKETLAVKYGQRSLVEDWSDILVDGSG